MASQIEFVVFTIVPLCAMVAMIVYSSLKNYKFDDKRPLLLVLLLSLMTLHQWTEIVQFASGTFYEATSPTAEAFETGANLLASAGSYFVLQQISELRTTRNEIEASNAALNERSSMVSVLNRILRHNVRNEVNVIANRAELLRNDVANDRISEDLKTIEDTALRLATISDRTQHTKSLLTEGPTSATTLHLPECLETPIERVRAAAPDAMITLEGENDTCLLIEAPATFPTAVGDVVEQIVATNSDSVHVDVRVFQEPIQNGTSDDSVIIVIDDDGDGLPESDLQAVEDEEETPLRHGEGLSLWSLKWLVKRADGKLDTHPDDATLEIQLPQSTGAAVDGQ